MDKKYTYIVFSSICCFILTLFVSTIALYEHKIQTIHNSYAEKNEKIKQENTISRTFFEDTFQLQNYEQAEYSLEPSSHKIIDGIRKLHQAPILINWAVRNQELCAGFIWLLSEELWWKNLPYYIGMMDQESRTPAQAWKLADSYKYFWWKILADFSKKFDPYKKDLWEKVSAEEIQSFFVNAFSEKALFWDIWFLYNSTSYVQDIVKSWNYNSHITKNMWISEFSKTLEKVENIDHKEIFKQNFSCKSQNFEKLLKTLEYYKFKVNDKNVVFDSNTFYYISDENIKLQKVDFNYLDTLSYNDVTLTHFFKGTSHVDSLLEMSCKWDFMPINIISINPRLIEKK